MKSQPVHLVSIGVACRCKLHNVELRGGTLAVSTGDHSVHLATLPEECFVCKENREKEQREQMSRQQHWGEGI